MDENRRGMTEHHRVRREDRFDPRGGRIVDAPAALKPCGRFPSDESRGCMNKVAAWALSERSGGGVSREDGKVGLFLRRG
jgi:hypothetical protein